MVNVHELEHQKLEAPSGLFAVASLAGAFCVATPTSCSNIYVGYGLKNEEYKPAMPPPVQNEYAGDLTEATDLPPKPPTPEAEDGEGGSEEGEGEEEY